MHPAPPPQPPPGLPGRRIPVIALVAAPTVLLAWLFGSGLATLAVRFPTIPMVVFFAVAWIPLVLLALRSERLAAALESTDVVTRGTKVQVVALLALAAILTPIVAALYVPGVRLAPLDAPPGELVHVIAARGLDDMEIYLFLGDDDHLIQLTDSAGPDLAGALSPDRQRVVFASRRDGDWDLYVLLIRDPSRVVRLTDAPGSDLDPVWSPDGDNIAFTSDRTGGWDVWTIRADGSRPRDITNEPGSDETNPSWSPDDTAIAYGRVEGDTSDVWVRDLVGAAPRNVTMGTAGWATSPLWSSDGALLAFTGWAAGNADVYTISADGGGLRQVTDDPSNEWGGGWFDDDRYIWLISDRPEFGFNFAYYVPASGGEPILYLRA